jgi:hypothetical protein
MLSEGFSCTHKLSIDAALFPFLHPGGKGAFKTSDSLEGLLSQRIPQLSPFTHAGGVPTAHVP